MVSYTNSNPEAVVTAIREEAPLRRGKIRGRAAFGGRGGIHNDPNAEGGVEIIGVTVVMSADAGKETVDAIREVLLETLQQEPYVLKLAHKETAAPKSVKPMAPFDVSVPSYNPVAEEFKITLKPKSLPRNQAIVAGSRDIHGDRVLEMLRAAEVNGKKIIGDADQFVEAPAQEPASGKGR